MAKALGKGLAALIRNHDSDQHDNNVQIKNIVSNPNQPRHEFDEQEMLSLVKSISEKGIIQPHAVRQINNKQFELISGERRLRAATTLGLKTVPVHIINVKDDSDSMELALIENIQRIDLNAMEEAKAYAVLIKKHHRTQLEIAKKVSKSRSEIANKIRLLKLPKIIQDSIKKKKINYGHARALVSIKSPSKILKIYNAIIEKKLSVRQTELLIKSLNNNKTIKTISLKNYIKQISWLKKYLNTNVKIIDAKKNKIIIEFANDKELDIIINKIINE